MKQPRFNSLVYEIFYKCTKYSIIIALLVLQLNTFAQQLAFPTAKGAGAFVTGGRGGQVIHVTTLNATGPGSLVEALNTPGARQIVFDVGGTIDLRSTFGRFQYVVNQSVNDTTYNDVTINGQTAPGGITIESRWFGFNNVDNVIWRYVRFSHDQVPGNNDDVVTMNSEDMMFDHCSFTHGNDEGVSVYGASLNLNIGDITFQHNLFFNNKTGMIIGGTGDVGGFTVLSNLFANTSHRFPNLGNRTDAQFDIINNVVYNFKSRWLSMGSDVGPDSEVSVNYIANYFKPSNYFRNIFGAGDDYIKNNANQIQEYSLDPDGVEIYTANNVAEGVEGWSTPEVNDEKMWTNFNYSGWDQGQWNYIPLAESPWFVSTQHTLNGQSFPIETAMQAYTNVLADVGANKYLSNNHTAVSYRTPTDQLAIEYVTNDASPYGGGHEDSLVIMGEHISNVTRPANWDTDLDGMPDSWEISTYGDLTKTSSGDENDNGYTNLQEYLNLIDGDVQVVDVTGVNVSPATATINIPETITLTSSVEPVNATNQSGIWTSSDTGIATVNANGVVTPVAVGEVIITFNTNSGGFSDSATITVTNIPIGVESVSLSPETLELNINVTGEIIATILPSNATNQTGVWSSSSTNIATVNQEGIVQPVAVGETIINFTSNDGGFTATATVTVTDNNYGTYEFYNADSDNLIQVVDGGEVFDLDIIGDNINFRSIPAGGDGNTGVESVGVEWSGAEDGTYAENAPLYAGLNQHTGNDYWPYTVQEGTYVFTVKYYSENQLGGDLVATDVFTLTFVRGNYVSAGDDASICLGDTQHLTASGAESYLWNTGETSESIAVTPNTTTTYTVTGTHNDGSTTEDSVTVTVNEIPTVDAGADETICQGESITLTATVSSGSLVWSNGATTPSITISPSDTTTYSVTVNSNGCTSLDEVTVNVIEAPIAHVSDDITIANGESATLSASGGVSYEWSTGETTDSITVTPTTTTTYNVIVTNGNNCIDTANVTVTVIGPVVANAGDDVSICEGESIVLSASGGDAYLWNNGDTTQSIIVSPENTSNYSVTVSDAYTSDTDSVLVTVNPVPVVDAGNDVTINQGESVTLYGSGGNNYLWSTGDTNANISVSPTETTTYNVTTIINGCSDTDSVTVTVITLVQALAGDDQSICLGGDAVLTAEGGDTYLWSTGETTQSITVSPDSNTDYTVTVTNQYGSDSDDVSVIISECPAMDFEFRAYPNPTTGVINVKISGLNTISIIQVTDVLGKQLKYIEVQPNSGQTTNLTVDISGMPKGFYMMTLYGDNRTITKKMVLR